MKTILLAAGLFLSLCACKKSEGGPDDNSDGQKGFLTGTVKDSKGNPMQGITVLADNTLYYNSYRSGVTDANGKYRISLPNGTYAAYAEFEKEFNGKLYKIKLHPDNANPFSQEGAVVNFEWKLTGRIPGGNGLRSGGTIMVDSDFGSEILDRENIEFTLTPQGTLIDGSEGNVIKMNPGQPQTDEYGRLVDIPIGRYKITAVYNNQTIRLRKGNSGNAFTNEVTIDFEPSTIWGDNMAFVDYKE